MRERTVGIIMNGVTGRMGTRQHLIRSILAIRQRGGLRLRDGTMLMPEPILVGRSEAKLQALAKAHGLGRWTTSLEEALADPDAPIYFDAQVTTAREAGIRQAIAAGKHIYTEKPTAETLQGAVALARKADAAGVRHGVVQDKIFLPGLRKVKRLIDGGALGRLLSVRGEFGYWVFEGDWQEAQRPSWNYRAEDGGGVMIDMFCHWRYVLDNTFGECRSVTALGATHIPERVDEQGATYRATADDAAYGIFELEGGVIAQINSSWTTRPFRDELVEFHVDGTEGSAVAGLRRCRFQHRGMTPKPVWNPDLPETNDYRAQWQEIPDNDEFDNGFKIEWELFLRHLYDDDEFKWTLWEGAKGVQLAEAGLQSWKEGRRIDLPPLR